MKTVPNAIRLKRVLHALPEGSLKAVADLEGCSEEEFREAVTNGVCAEGRRITELGSQILSLVKDLAGELTKSQASMLTEIVRKNGDIICIGPSRRVANRLALLKLVRFDDSEQPHSLPLGRVVAAVNAAR